MSTHPSHQAQPPQGGQPQPPAQGQTPATVQHVPASALGHALAAAAVQQANWDRPFLKQLGGFLRQEVLGRAKDHLGAIGWALLLPLGIGASWQYRNTGLVEGLTLLSVVLVAFISLFAVAKPKTLSDYPRVMPAITVFAQATTLFVAGVSFFYKVIQRVELPPLT